MPPRAAPVVGPVPSPFLRQTPLHQLALARRRSLPLPPQHTPQPVPQPAVPLLQHSLGCGQLEVRLQSSA